MAGNGRIEAIDIAIRAPGRIIEILARERDFVQADRVLATAKSIMIRRQSEQTYIALGMINFFLLCILAVFVFGVPHKGDFLLLTIAALFYVTAATGLGLLISAFTRSQIATIFATSLATIIPFSRFSGMA